MSSLVTLLNFSILSSSLSLPTSTLEKYVLIAVIGLSLLDLIADIIVFLQESKSSRENLPKLTSFKHFFINLILLSIFLASTPELIIKILS